MGLASLGTAVATHALDATGADDRLIIESFQFGHRQLAAVDRAHREIATPRREILSDLAALYADQPAVAAALSPAEHARLANLADPHIASSSIRATGIKSSIVGRIVRELRALGGQIPLRRRMDNVIVGRPDPRDPTATTLVLGHQHAHIPARYRALERPPAVFALGDCLEASVGGTSSYSAMPIRA